MKKKVLLIGLVLLIMIAALLVYINRPVLQRGSMEDLLALTLSDTALYRDAEGSYHKARTDARDYLLAMGKGSELRKQLGGARFITGQGDGNYLLLYVTEPTEQLRAQLQADPTCADLELGLAQCDYSIDVLLSAEEKLENWLQTAPESVRESVQMYMILPDQNRLAVFVKDWSGSDQLRMALALGGEAAKCFLVEGDLQTLSESVYVADHKTETEEHREKPGKPAKQNEITRALDFALWDLRTQLCIIYPEDDLRLQTLQLMTESRYPVLWSEEQGCYAKHGGDTSYYDIEPEEYPETEQIIRVIWSLLLPGENVKFRYNVETSGDYAVIWW